MRCLRTVSHQTAEPTVKAFMSIEKQTLRGVWERNDKIERKKEEIRILDVPINGRRYRKNIGRS